MFYNCTSLTTAPIFPLGVTISNGAYYCCQEMFRNCSSLNYIKAMFTAQSSSSITTNWVVGVASTGTFVTTQTGQNGWRRGDSGIPTNWTVQVASE